MRPETRGFLFGLSLGIAALAGFGAAQIGRDMLGHFAVAATGDSATPRVFVIDTIQGEVWERGAEGKGFVSIGSPFGK